MGTDTIISVAVLGSVLLLVIILLIWLMTYTIINIKNLKYKINVLSSSRSKGVLNEDFWDGGPVDKYRDYKIRRAQLRNSATPVYIDPVDYEGHNSKNPMANPKKEQNSSVEDFMAQKVRQPSSYEQPVFMEDRRNKNDRDMFSY